MEKPASDGEISRRSFLSCLIAIAGGAIAAVLGGAGTGYFLSPLWRKKEEAWIDIGPVKDFAEGTPSKVDFTVRKRDAWSTIESRSSAWIVTADRKEFIAYDPKCTHLGCPYRWDDLKKQFLCPCHAAVFDVDGRVVKGPPPRPLDRYTAKVVGGRLMILPQAVRGHV